MHCCILLWARFFHGQSPVDEARFCRVGRVILSTGVVGMDLGICLLDFFGQDSVCSLYLDVGQTLYVRYFWIRCIVGFFRGARPSQFVFWIWGHCVDYFVGQTLPVCFFFDGGGEDGALLDSFVDNILPWAIPSRRSKLLSNGNRHSVEWYCGVGCGDLIVGFFRGPDSVCSLFLDLK